MSWRWRHPDTTVTHKACQQAFLVKLVRRPFQMAGDIENLKVEASLSSPSEAGRYSKRDLVLEQIVGERGWIDRSCHVSKP